MVQIPAGIERDELPRYVVVEGAIGVGKTTLVGKLSDPWFAGVPEVDLVDSDKPCKTALQTFEDDASKYAELFAALRIAALEIDGNYDPVIHDSGGADGGYLRMTPEGRGYRGTLTLGVEA